MAIVRAAAVARSGSIVIRRHSFGGRTSARMWMRSEVQLPSPSIGYVGVELRRGEVGVAEELLDAPQIGAALEQVRRERVAEEVRVHAPRLEPGPLGQPAQDQERTGTRERPAAGVEEELRPVAAV